MPIVAAQDRILVVMQDKEEMTPGGIYLPDEAKKKPLEGVIVSVGAPGLLPNGMPNPIPYQEGDRIMVNKWAGHEFKHDGVEYLSIHRDDVQAVIA